MNKPLQQSAPVRQYGAAMVEFALTLPLLTILLFGSAEVGRVLYQQNVLTKAVMSGSRFIARSPDALTADCAQDSGWTAVTAKASNLIAYSQDDAAELRLAGLDAADAIVFTPRSEMLNGNTVCVISTQAQTEFDGVFGAKLIPLLDIGPVQLKALEEERYIGD
jgi:Flp pilus assembly protein TadG